MTRKFWTKEEDNLLMEAMEKYDGSRGKTPQQDFDDTLTQLRDQVMNPIADYIEKQCDGIIKQRDRLLSELTQLKARQQLNRHLDWRKKLSSPQKQ